MHSFILLQHCFRKIEVRYKSRRRIFLYKYNILRLQIHKETFMFFCFCFFYRYLHIVYFLFNTINYQRRQFLRLENVADLINTYDFWSIIKAYEKHILKRLWFHFLVSYHRPCHSCRCYNVGESIYTNGII